MTRIASRKICYPQTKKEISQYSQLDTLCCISRRSSAIEHGRVFVWYVSKDIDCYDPEALHCRKRYNDCHVLLSFNPYFALRCLLVISFSLAIYIIDLTTPLDFLRCWNFNFCELQWAIDVINEELHIYNRGRIYWLVGECILLNYII